MYVEECVINKKAKIHEKAMTLELGKIPLSSLRIFLGFLLWWWFGGIYRFRKNWHVACFVDLNLFVPFCLDSFFFLDDLTGFEIT